MPVTVSSPWAHKTGFSVVERLSSASPFRFSAASIGLLSATAGVTVGYARSNRSFVPVAIGAILFLVSDLLLAVWIFHDLVYTSFDLVWLSYGVGQMLIVLGTFRFIHCRSG